MRVVRLAAVLVFALIPAATAAKDFFFPEIRIDIAVATDGSFVVDEFRTFAFEGEFSWASLWIPLKVERQGRTYAAGIEDFAVYEGPTRLESEFKERGGRFEAKWFFSARDEQRTFRIHYRIRGGIRGSAETTELYWQPIGSGWEKPASLAVIKVSLPAPVSDVSELLVYGHGPLSGNSEVVDLQTVTFTVPNLAAGQEVEIRVAWPAGMVAAVSDESIAVASIREEEAGFVADTISRSIQSSRRSAWWEKTTEKFAFVFLGGFFAFPLLWLIAFFFSWRRQGREYAFDDIPEYVREPPSDLAPALVDLLRWQGATVSPAAFTATIFDLARRGFIEIEDRTEEKKGLFGPKFTTAALLTIKKNPGPGDRILPFEQDVLGLLGVIGSNDPSSGVAALAAAFGGSAKAFERFRRIRSGAEHPISSLAGTSLMSTDLTSWMTKNPMKFRTWFQAWIKSVKAEGKNREFVEPASLKRQKHFIIAAIPPGILTLNPFLALEAALLAPKLKRSSFAWARENAMWKGLKKFLNDFSDFKELPPEAYRLWERYLVFGILFGSAHKIAKTLPVILADERAAAPVWYPAFNRTTAALSPGGMTSIAAMIKSIESAATTIQQASHSAAHYSSGSGGGFSSGGGGGGGGGGGSAG